MLTAEQIESNWNKLIRFIEDGFDGERRERLLKLYNDHDNRIAQAPASSRVYFHSAFVGGYVHHVLNVMKIAPKVSSLWESIGGEKTWTDEELFFVAMNHDLGKVGDIENDNYIPTDEDWKKKRGMEFESNPKIEYMQIEDRSLFWLQHYGIKMSKREFIAIRAHDGLYQDPNKPYYIQWGAKEVDRFVHVIHTADMLASKLEWEEWAKTPEARPHLEGNGSGKPISKKTKTTVKKAFNPKKLENADIKIEKFEDLFGNAFKDNEK